MNPRAERGAVAIGAVALLLLLALVAGAGLRAGRSLVLDERVHGSADAVALAAATVLDRRYGDAVDAGGSPSAARATQQAARAAAERAAGRLGLTLESISFERGGHDASPLAVRVHVVAGRHGASARAGVGFGASTPVEGFRAADVRGLDAAGAVVAAAVAQLGWPYVWGGESRAEGGFDCSGLIDYALTVAGLPVGVSQRPGCSGSRVRFPPARCCRQATSCSWACRPITWASSWRPGSQWRRRTAARSCASNRSATAAGRAPGGWCCRARVRRPPRARGARLRARAPARAARASRAGRAGAAGPPRSNN